MLREQRHVCVEVVASKLRLNLLACERVFVFDEDRVLVVTPFLLNIFVIKIVLVLWNERCDNLLFIQFVPGEVPQPRVFLELGSSALSTNTI